MPDMAQNVGSFQSVGGHANRARSVGHDSQRSPWDRRQQGQAESTLTMAGKLPSAATGTLGLVGIGATQCPIVLPCGLGRWPQSPPFIGISGGGTNSLSNRSNAQFVAGGWQDFGASLDDVIGTGNSPSDLRNNVLPNGIFTFPDLPPNLDLGFGFVFCDAAVSPAGQTVLARVWSGRQMSIGDKDIGLQTSEWIWSPALELSITCGTNNTVNARSRLVPPMVGASVATCIGASLITATNDYTPGGSFRTLGKVADGWCLGIADLAGSRALVMQLGLGPAANATVAAYPFFCPI